MTPRVADHLRKVELFQGLSEPELADVATACQAVRVTAGRPIFQEGDEGDELFIVYEGSVRVALNTRKSDGTSGPATINVLYAGQCFGEMVLLNGAVRSATVTATEPSTLIVIREPAFRALCENNPRIGYCVMRNLATDLAYKLRSSNLLLRGNVRLADDR
jgi:CRP/FNR family transcriptional regulator, cyclic AMP receptor protein